VNQGRFRDVMAMFLVQFFRFRRERQSWVEAHPVLWSRYTGQSKKTNPALRPVKFY
jgi:hypothetical protein